MLIVENKVNVSDCAACQAAWHLDVSAASLVRTYRVYLRET